MHMQSTPRVIVDVLLRIEDLLVRQELRELAREKRDTAWLTPSQVLNTTLGDYTTDPLHNRTH